MAIRYCIYVSLDKKRPSYIKTDLLDKQLTNCFINILASKTNLTNRENSHIFFTLLINIKGYRIVIFKTII